MVSKTIEERRSRRVHMGMVPDIYDKVSCIYPDDRTEVYVFTLLNVATGEDEIAGYVEVVYTDETKEKLLTVTRLAE